MKNILILAGVFCLGIAFSQKTNTIFPNDFYGIYKGELHITTEKGKQKIPMEFHLLPSKTEDNFQYKLVYNNVPRNYTLRVKNKEKGVYEIDENNGIVLPASFHNNVLYSFFEVQGNFLSTRIDFSASNEFILFEILFSRLANKTTTGNTSKEIPEVFGYPITVFQKATLKKQ
jgi:hypothetical protein